MPNFKCAYTVRRNANNLLYLFNWTVAVKLIYITSCIVGGRIFPKGRFPMTLNPRDFTQVYVSQGGFFPRRTIPKCTFSQGYFSQGGLFPRVIFPRRTFPKSNFPKGNFPKGIVPKGTFPKAVFPNGKLLFTLHNIAQAIIVLI